MDKKQESPFVFEDAVPLDKFFDRDEEIDFFVRNLSVKRKMLLCIVAPLKYGKSSLMRKYLQILKERGDIIPIYINLKEIKNPLRYIVEQLREFDIDLRRQYEDALRGEELVKLFETLNGILEERDSWLFLLFDEFHLLPELIKSEGFFNGLSDEIIFGFFRGFAEGRRISYIVCGSVIEPLMRALDVWGGRFETLYLGPFDEADAVGMIKRLFAEGGIAIKDEDAKNIAEAAGYHPFYIQYMGHHIYTLGKISRATIRHAKQKLFNYILPIFITYLEKIGRMGKKYLKTIAKIIHNEPPSIEDIPAISDLIRMGILKTKDAEFEIIDPLFKRYLEQTIQNLRPTEVTVVGHWAERIVGNYLLRKGYMPYYSHDSRGAFDIYVKIKNIDVGIQVKYSKTGEVYLTKEEVEKIMRATEETRWKPIIALVGEQIKFFPEIRQGKYSTKSGYADILEAI